VRQLENLIFACAKTSLCPESRYMAGVDKTDLEIEAIEAKEMRSGARAKRPAFTEERVLCGAVSAPSDNSVQWLCFRGARTHPRTSREFQDLSRRAACGK
jgi:hypothetical protein